MNIPSEELSSRLAFIDNDDYAGLLKHVLKHTAHETRKVMSELPTNSSERQRLNERASEIIARGCPTLLKGESLFDLVERQYACVRETLAQMLKKLLCEGKQYGQPSIYRYQRKCLHWRLTTHAANFPKYGMELRIGKLADMIVDISLEEPMNRDLEKAGFALRKLLWSCSGDR